LQYQELHQLLHLKLAEEFLNEFADAVKQTKKVVFDEYDALSKAANKEGNVVDLNRVIPELDKAANDTVLNLRDPGTAKYAAEMAKRFKEVGSLTTEQAQQFITDMNADLQSFYRNPSYGSASKVQIDALIANNMREGLDQVIETAVGPGYQRLKNIYGALKTIESLGNEQWCKLNINKEEGILSVTVPKKFLKNANYPVFFIGVVNPPVNLFPSTKGVEGVSVEVGSGAPPNICRPAAVGN